MSKKISHHTDEKIKVRYRRKKKIFSGIREKSPDRPRLSVFRSNKNIFVQLIDDNKGTTIAAASTLEEDLRGKAKANIEGAKKVGTLIAKRALAKNVSEIVFDRSGYIYHGRIKAIAEAAREGGLKF